MDQQVATPLSGVGAGARRGRRAGSRRLAARRESLLRDKLGPDRRLHRAGSSSLVAVFAPFLAPHDPTTQFTEG